MTEAELEDRFQAFVDRPFRFSNGDRVRLIGQKQIRVVIARYKSGGARHHYELTAPETAYGSISISDEDRLQRVKQ